MFTRILVCSDGSELAHQAARAAAGIAKQSEAVVVLLHVLDFQNLPGSLPETYEESLRPEALRFLPEQLQQVVEPKVGDIFREARVPYQAQHEFGHPAEKIIEVAEREQVDLIVMGSRGLGARKAHLLDSVSDAVVHRARCSVLVVRDRPTAE